MSQTTLAQLPMGQIGFGAMHITGSGIWGPPRSEGEAIAPADIPPGGPQVMAWPMDPTTKVVRDGSRLNQVLLLRLDPEEFDEDTRPRSAEGAAHAW